MWRHSLVKARPCKPTVTATLVKWVQVDEHGNVVKVKREQVSTLLINKRAVREEKKMKIERKPLGPCCCAAVYWTVLHGTSSTVL
jgi:hypothetical protein